MFFIRFRHFCLSVKCLFIERKRTKFQQVKSTNCYLVKFIQICPYQSINFHSSLIPTDNAGNEHRCCASSSYSLNLRINSLRSLIPTDNAGNEHRCCASSSYSLKICSSKLGQILSLVTSIRREEGIRTLDTLLAYTHFPGVRLRPLGHLSFSLSSINALKGCQITKKIAAIKIFWVEILAHFPAKRCLENGSEALGRNTLAQQIHQLCQCGLCCYILTRNYT